MISYCKNGKSAQVLACPQEKFDEIADSQRVKQICEQLLQVDHDSDEAKELKCKLPLLMFMASFSDGHRHAESAQPTGMAYLDLDDLQGEDPREAWGRIEETLKEKGLSELTRLVHVSCSGKGLRIVYAIPSAFSNLKPEEQIDRSKQWLSQTLGVADDQVTKDLARGSFAVPREYILYLDNRLFAEQTETPEVEIAEANVKCSMSSGPAPTNPNEEPTAASLLAFDLCARQAGLNAESMDVWGEHNWHTNLMAVLSVGVAKLMTRQQLEAVVAQRLPNYSQTADCQSLIAYFYEKYDADRGFMNASLREINAKAQGQMANVNEDEDLSPALSQGEGESPKGRFSAKKLPIGLKESLVGIPESMHMPVLCAVLPLAAAYADGVEVEYCDGQRHKLGLMSIIRGEQASNKSICKLAVDVWKRQFDQEDAIARRREDEWKEARKRRKANEKAPEDPRVLVRVVPVTVSCSTLLKRLKNAQGHTLYSFGEELDTLRKTNGAGSWSSKYDIYRVAFDHGEWGQDYNSDQAESGVVSVAYNWTMLGTYGAVRRCFKSENIENGLSSRVLMAEMPDGAFAKLTKFSRRSEADEARIQEAVTRLRSCSGFIDTPRLRKAIEKWVEAKRQEAARNIDHVMDIYRRRAAVIGFRCGVIHHLLQDPSPRSPEGESPREGVNPSPRGGQEGVASIRFAIAIAEYCLTQQMKAFGETLLSAHLKDGKDDSKRSVNKSIFDQLPPVFGMGDLKALKHGDCNDDSLRTVVSRWRRDEWVDKIDSKHWRKRIL